MFFRSLPLCDAIQWDDFLAYSVNLPGANRTAKLTKFSIDLIESTKQANPAVSFDLCHLNPDWSKRTLSAVWQQWHVDWAFVQLYSEPAFRSAILIIDKWSVMWVAQIEVFDDAGAFGLGEILDLGLAFHYQSSS